MKGQAYHLIEESVALIEIEEQMRLMIKGECLPYDAAWVIWGKAMSAVRSPDLMHPLWLIWGALTDWVELKPEELPQAEVTMVRAAKEWLSIPKTDSHGRTTYLNRWVYDEMGYERNPGEPATADGGE